MKKAGHRRSIPTIGSDKTRKALADKAPVKSVSARRARMPSMQAGSHLFSSPAYAAR